MASRAAKRAAEKRRLRELYEKGNERRDRKDAHAKRGHQQAVAHLREQKIAREMHQPRRPHRERHIWSDHVVDQGVWHGTRNSTRGATPTCAQWGISFDLDGLHPLAFREGHALYIQREQGDWSVKYALTGEVIGYAPPAMAMGYKLAAERVGIILEVYDG